MRRQSIPAGFALAFALITGACTEDSDGVSFGPGGDVNGTWVVQRASGTTYLRVLPTTVEMFVEGDTCFEKSEYAIQQIDGPSFTLVAEEGGGTSTWSFERVGDALSVTIGADALTLEPADVDVTTLAVCGGPEPDFPNPGCAAIPAIEVGGSETGSLGDGDARWTDDTWYDLWSVQLAAGQTVTISMTADDQEQLDTYMMLYDAAAVTRIDDNDDVDYDGGNYNSRIGPIALEAGCYIIVANSYSGDDAGETGGGYSLSVVAN